MHKMKYRKNFIIFGLADLQKLINKPNHNLNFSKGKKIILQELIFFPYRYRCNHSNKTNFVFFLFFLDLLCSL